jgi:hypothetical protein
MRVKLCWLVPAVLLLSGCGPRIDDPSNVPKLGQWHRESRLVALVINDLWVDRKDSPFKIPDDIDETKDCVEPTITRREEIDEEIRKQTDGLCRIDSLDRNGATVSTKGSCGPEDKNGMTLSGTAEYEGHESETGLNGHSTVMMNVRMPDGHSERVRAGFEAHWTRLGDCK